MQTNKLKKIEHEFEVITSLDFIEKYQEEFKNRLLEELDEEREARIGFQGDIITSTIYYSRICGIWFAQSDEPTRYWNAFGIEDPYTKKVLNISVEINIPYEHTRMVSGVFLKDKNDQIYIGHRGKINNVKKKEFTDLYKGQWVNALDENETNPVVLISPLSDSNLIIHIRRFIEKVICIKLLKKQKQSQQTNDSTYKFSPESEFTSTYSTNKQIYPNSDHAKVVNELVDRLKRKNLNPYNTKEIDILLLDITGDYTHIFEIKPKSDTQTIYTAIGQLFIHSVNRARTRKILVIPNSIDKSMLDKLKFLNIDVIMYSIINGKLEFDGLDNIM